MMTTRIARFLTLLIAALSVPAAEPACGAEEWPQFRGPGGEGHSAATGLPAEWGPEKNVRWNVEVPGKGWSSPVVSDGRIYLTTAVPGGESRPADQSLRTLCLEAESGRIVWNVEVFRQDGETAGRIHRKNSHASPTPIVDGGRVFVHFGTHGTACLKLDGSIVWRTRQLEYNPVHGSGGSPVLVDGLLIVSCDGGDVQFVVALDRETGGIRWKKERPSIERPRKFSFSTPQVIEVDGRKQVVSPGTNHVVAYEPATGREIWSYRYSGYSVIPRPVYGHGLLYLSTGYDNATLLALRPDGRGELPETNLAWTLDKGAPHTPSPLLVGEELYLVSDRGIATCVDASTGEVHWRERLGGNYSASPLYADGKIYFQNEDGGAVVIRPGTEYVELARNRFPGARTLASYAVVDSALLIRTGDRLYRIESD